MLEPELKNLDAWSWSQSLKIEFLLHSPSRDYIKTADFIRHLLPSAFFMLVCASHIMSK